ncbi:YaiI/YqxD family protein [Legionella jordanis]|uniref:UPF0178 protein Ljor_0652 n=1 Tax=Legionella jordanis TaxID=456 RepID=A0A0W0V8D3_9GAMM|nr:YaiI/YqxD family protein [Legionella jordanis]KTD16346.1 hypothetical protein Ljor_0652 [Legionella jordanis]RMX04442.1 YaiI/YqxD family protein [Legionella jordanis]RMX20988.1 YaiI/YqxD family protein [Legionella jordanis]VEH12196.1 Uncharacterized BCR, YaiI/YqxD family COG1671 [Legionella jordanis]HAT8713406.1 YaiI/YqxD family protein [Legionella jordanis]
MTIWIDGDACPKAIKTVLFRAAVKRSVLVIIVANHFAQIPSSEFIKSIKVESGCDRADQYIISQVKANDLVITADILLADLVIAKEAFALNPRGQLYSLNNIKQHLSIRNLNQTLREGGIIGGGEDKLNAKDIQCFSNQLDRILTQRTKIQS